MMVLANGISSGEGVLWGEKSRYRWAYQGMKAMNKLDIPFVTTSWSAVHWNQ